VHNLMATRGVINLFWDINLQSLDKGYK